MSAQSTTGILPRRSQSRDLRRYLGNLSNPRPSDSNHEAAKACWFALLESSAQLFTTNYVVVESCALGQSRLGLEAVRSISEEILPVIETVWVDESAHSIAMATLLAAQRRKLSLVDCVSFVVSRLRGSQVAFAFDQHFVEEGFRFPG